MENTREHTFEQEPFFRLKGKLTRLLEEAFYLEEKSSPLLEPLEMEDPTESTHFVQQFMKPFT